jgi:diketogulonate reductase-like aldo/keto reductase
MLEKDANHAIRHTEQRRRHAVLGFGVYQISDPAECERCVLDAIEVGYRSIDTAQPTATKKRWEVPISKSGAPRTDLFVTTKVWISNAGHEKAAASIDESLAKLQMVTSTCSSSISRSAILRHLSAMEDPIGGKVRAIGVSNFYPDRLIDLVQFQRDRSRGQSVETHPSSNRRRPTSHEKVWRSTRILGRLPKVARTCSPMRPSGTSRQVRQVGGSGHSSFSHPARRGGIPKTTHKERMIENLAVFDFELDEEDMKTIAALDTQQSALFRTMILRRSSS